MCALEAYSRTNSPSQSVCSNVKELSTRARHILGIADRTRYLQLLSLLPTNFTECPGWHQRDYWSAVEDLVEVMQRLNMKPIPAKESTKASSKPDQALETKWIPSSKYLP